MKYSSTKTLATVLMVVQLAIPVWARADLTDALRGLDNALKSINKGLSQGNQKPNPSLDPNDPWSDRPVQPATAGRADWGWGPQAATKQAAAQRINTFNPVDPSAAQQLDANFNATSKMVANKRELTNQDLYSYVDSVRP